MKPVRIVGGGITGLCAAWRLRSHGIPFQLFEASGRVGGVIRTRTCDGYLLESGSNTILETCSEVTDLIRELGLEDRRLYPSGLAANRYVVHHGIPVRLPHGMAEAASTPLLGIRDKIRILAEPLISRGRAEDESLASFVRRRFGGGLLHSVIDPFVAGVYAGNPSELSVRHAFPKLYALEQDYGSVIGGAIRGRRKRSQSTERSKATASMFSFTGGLRELPDRLHELLRDSIHLNHRESELRPKPGEPVLICAPAAVAADLVPELNVLRRIPYAPVARVALGFRRDQVNHPLDGFGVLVPARENFRILGVFFSSSLFPDRAPDGNVLMTVFLGGSRQPELVQQTKEQIAEIAVHEVSRLLGIAGQPAFSDVEVIPRAIPQYNLGFTAMKAATAEAERSCPGLFFAGAWRDGVSVSDCIAAGFRTADRVAEYVKNGKENRTSADQYRVA